MVVYFTGTGNSRYCAEQLADRLGDDLLDSTSYLKNQIAADLVTGKPWVFVSPTYAWRLPHIFSNFIRSGTFHGHQDAYFVMTCGSDIGDAGSYLSKLCEEVGFNYKGVFPIVMPENYIAMFDVPNEQEAAEIIAQARPALHDASTFISQCKSFPEQNITSKDRLKSGTVNTVFYKKYVKAKGFYTTDACIGCGQCVERCILNNIMLHNKRPQWGDRCTHCMACICGCPVEAIEYGKKSLGKPRYWCKEI